MKTEIRTMFDNVEDHLKGEFNSGLAIIYRLDSIHKLLHIAKLRRDHESYYWGLVAYFTELVRVMSPKDELGDHKGYWDKVKADYFSIRQSIIENKDVAHKLYESFVIWELELTLVEQKYNLGMPKKGDPRFAMMSGRK